MKQAEKLNLAISTMKRVSQALKVQAKSFDERWPLAEAERLDKAIVECQKGKHYKSWKS